MIAKEFENNGQNVRKYYQKRLPSNPAKDYYYILRDTPNNESIIVEYGFVDSSGDDVDLLKNDWQNLAEGVVKALTEYAGGKYVPVTGTDYYIVKSGDSLWSIAKKYNTTVAELKTKNNLSTNLLKIGQILYIPSKEETPDATNTYIIKSGDNLYKIANMYNITVNELKKLNNLTSNLLSIGQVLKIPSNYKNYVVQKGDTLYSIAKRYGTTVSELESLNNLSTSALSIGQNLLIP